MRKNNFKSEDAKQRSRYRLWVLYKPQYEKLFTENPFTYFGFNTKPDGGFGSLKKLAESRTHMFKMAILYDNHAADRDNNEIMRWEAGGPKPPSNNAPLFKKQNKYQKPAKKYRAW